MLQDWDNAVFIFVVFHTTLSLCMMHLLVHVVSNACDNYTCDYSFVHIIRHLIVCHVSPMHVTRHVIVLSDI